MAHSHFLFKNRGLLTRASVKNTIVLNITSVANADVVHVAAQYRVTPNGRLLAKMYVANYLSAGIDIRALRNLRINPTKWPDHIFGHSSTRAETLVCGPVAMFVPNRRTEYNLQVAALPASCEGPEVV
jgi:hypothetical protein